MDGIGSGDGGAGDAVARARTPTLDRLLALRSATRLQAHGIAVGMPSNKDMGNSEVGHNALGAGRVFDQGAKLVANAIESGRVYEGKVWRETVARVKATGEPLHFLGLLSDGNVHSHIDHLLALLEQAAREGVARARVHTLLDGRDVPGRSALTYVDRLESVLGSLQAAGHDYCIASGGGRMKITMDRYEADWGMVERGWDTHVRARGRTFKSAHEAITTYYAESERDDQYVDPFVIVDESGPVGPIRDGAALILYNFRGDRALEITRAFEQEDLGEFDRSPRPDVAYAGMMQYDGDLGIPRRFLVDPPAIDASMGELLAAAGKRQLAIAETQKFGHVTYFWNGNRSAKFDERLETYIEVLSDRIPFDQAPEMKAREVTDRLIAAMNEQTYDFVRVNYANGDMVGHTGSMEATLIAVEAVDAALARLVADIEERNGVLVVTADHGNADQMLDVAKDGSTSVRTSHSLNPVPFVIYDPREPDSAPRLELPENPQLANIAATCLELMGLASPEIYEPSLLGKEPG
jgi:2,3-bisphosphoglycerate-independent phosphoglycerate mutase